MKFPSFAVLALATVAASACTDATTGSLSFSLSSRKAPPIVAAPAFGSAPAGAPTVVVAAGDSTVIALGSDTVILRSVELVLKKIELKRVESASCDSISSNGDCEEFESGAALVALPLGTTAAPAQISVNAPDGMYDRLEFKIHKVDSTADAAFLAAHPGFGGVSIKVTGTFSNGGSRSDFTYTTSLDASEEMDLIPPVTVSGGTGINVTLRMDVSTWFLNGGKTALVDPASGNSGQPNESLVQGNIENSIHAFRDNNHDGADDDHEGS